MSKVARRMNNCRVRIYWAITLILASFLVFAIPVFAAETEDRAALEERKVFIQEAKKERWERVREELSKLSHSGIAAYMMVAELKPFGDWDFYYVKEGRITWSPNAGQQQKAVEVPEGFVTDLTSIPRFFWQILRPEGRYAYAAVVHDYLYWTQARPREEADHILKFALEDSKVDPKTVEAIYQAVHLFGQSAWDNNARLKKSGERRFLIHFPEDFTVSWDEWKKRPDVFAKE